MPRGVYQKTKEHKRKLSQAHKGKILSKETRERISNSKKGKKISEETRKGRMGRKLSKEHKKRIGEASIRLGLKPPTRYGEKNHFWKGGKSFELYGVDWTEDLRESIRKRDYYICGLCGIHQDELEMKLDCHHIDYDKKNLNPPNLISLCRACHLKTNFNREYWTNYFNELI